LTGINQAARGPREREIERDRGKSRLRDAGEQKKEIDPVKFFLDPRIRREDKHPDMKRP